MSLELWLGAQGLDQSREAPRTVLLPNGNIVIFTTVSASFRDHYTVVDPFGNQVASGRIDVPGGLEFFIDDVILREDGGFDILFGSGFSSIPTLYLLQVDSNFETVGPAQVVASQYGGGAEFVALPNGTMAVVYEAYDSGIQDVVLRIIAADGAIGAPVQANTSSNPGPLFVQIAANDAVIFTAWLDTANGTTIRARLFDHDGNPIGDEFSVSSSSGIDNRIFLDTLSDGSFVAGFVRRDSSGDNATALARLFSPAGQPVGDEFALTGNTGVSEAIVGVAALDDGGFLATWSGPDGISIRQFDNSGVPTTDALVLADLMGDIAIEEFDDGRYLVVGGGSTFTRYLIVDGRMGMVDGDENDNILLARNSGPSTINGFGGNDTLYGFDQDDTFYGGDGNDEFRSGRGNDMLFGGPGDDQYHLVDFTATITELEGEGIDTVFYSGRFTGGTLPDHVEIGVIAHEDHANITGNAGNNTLLGNDQANQLFGEGGDDLIEGQGGTDILDGGAGNDRVFGGAGDDRLRLGVGTDFIDGGEGGDEFQIFASNEASSGDVIDGGDGYDFILFDSPLSSFDLSLIDLRNVEAIAFFGTSLSLRMRASQLDGLQEMTGNNQFVITIVDGGSITLPDFRTSLRVTLSDFGNSLDATAITSRGIEVFGGAGNDTIMLSSLGGEAQGNGGDDVLFGSVGPDVIGGGDGADILNGGAGSDNLNGGSNVDTVVVSGTRSQYTVTQTSLGVFEISGPDGDDLLTAVEFLQFDDQTMRLLPGSGVNVNFETADPSVYQAAMNGIRDFDGNALGGNGSWLRIGSADVNGDGDIDQILVNDAIGRFATVGTAPDGLVYFNDYSWAGETRVAGIYIDPLVASGDVEAGGPNDSQRRFQNDLQIENINRVLGADDYDGDGLQEVYFALTDGTAYLHAYMHADGNIQYANYQSQQQVIDFLTANGFGPETYADWFPSGQEPEAKDAPDSADPPAFAPPPIHARPDFADMSFREANVLEFQHIELVEAFG